MPQSSAGIFVTVDTAYVETTFILADGNLYYYDTVPYPNAYADDAAFRVTSIIGFFQGGNWGGVYWNQYLASQTVFKHL